MNPREHEYLKARQEGKGQEIFIKKQQKKSEGNQKNMLPENSPHLALKEKVDINQQWQNLQHFKRFKELNFFSKIIEHTKDVCFIGMVLLNLL